MKAGKHLLLYILVIVGFSVSSCGKCHDCYHIGLTQRHCYKNLSKAKMEALKKECESGGGIWR